MRKSHPTIPKVYAYATLEDVAGYAVAMSHANVVVLMAAAAQPIVATSVAKSHMQRRRVLKDQLVAPKATKATISCMY